MPAQVDLCNMALSKVGESFIRDIAEESRPAKMCALMFAPVRDCVLRAYPWRFALKRWSAAALKKSRRSDSRTRFKYRPTVCAF